MRSRTQAALYAIREGACLRRLLSLAYADWCEDSKKCVICLGTWGPARCLIQRVIRLAGANVTASTMIASSSAFAAAGEASSRSGAYEANEALCPDVVVLDILLPSAEEGLEALESLAASGRLVVALSIREGLRAAAFAAGGVRVEGPMNYGPVASSNAGVGSSAGRGWYQASGRKA